MAVSMYGTDTVHTHAKTTSQLVPQPMTDTLARCSGFNSLFFRILTPPISAVKIQQQLECEILTKAENRTNEAYSSADHRQWN